MRKVLDMLRAAAGVVFPAAQLVVVDDGLTVLDEAVGDCTRETWFDVASLSKPLVTTTLTLGHIDAGRLALDEVLRAPGITVAHALSHSTGLPAWRPLADEARAAGATDLRAWILDAVRKEPLEAAPGSRSLYSDFGFMLLGEAVERAGGARISSQFRRIVKTSFPEGIAADHAPPVELCAPTLADLASRGMVHDENARALGQGSAGHAGLFATAGAVSQIVNRLVTAWLRRDARALGIASATMRRAWSASGVPGSTWCLGWDRPSPTGPSQAGARWPRDGVGHTGFTGCSIWIDPKRARWVVLLSNRVFPSTSNEEDRRSANPLIRDFRPAIHDAIVNELDGVG